MTNNEETTSASQGIAIVGMACRLPGAHNPGEFWRNLCDGKESIRFFSDEELLAAGVPEAALRRPDYVKAAPQLADVDLFDAAFFGYSPREAALIDPQQRLFLEVAWEAFEAAGYDPGAVEGDVGVFAGGGGVVTSYLMAHSLHEAFPGQTGGVEHISNDKDFLSTRVSYKLDLTGPSLTVQTACSTSLVALHLACQSIRAGECDMALAGASTIRIPHVSGYLAPRGGIYSSDGRCRAFDADGTGTIFGSGVAAVLLKGLAEALDDGDHIHAVIRSTAVNNDGGRKVSYTAPSVVGEARAMAEALSLADVPVESIRFVECHATGTTVGDPLEIQALTRAFRTRTREVGFCAVGSAKTNIGHAEQAAGMAGLIKTALVLEKGVIPPTPVETLNPTIPFEGSPFFLNRELSTWPEDGEQPRRAAVNSLGIGGTNAFAVLEQAPVRDPVPCAVRDRPLLCLSAKEEPALRARAAQFAEVLASVAPGDLGRVCHTANGSRSGFSHRLAITGDPETLRAKLAAYAAGGDGRGITSSRAQPGPVAFLFSGQGFQYPGMARALHDSQPTFRAALEHCCELARPWLEHDLLAVMLGREGAGDLLRQTAYTQPALFALEYALTSLWASWGIRPDAVLGHSVGEFAACCAAGVYRLEDAIALVAQRARLMQSLSRPGGMLAVFAPEEATRSVLSGLNDLSIAVVNGPGNTVISGAIEAIEAAEAILTAEGISFRRLEVSHAFHSGLMDPVLEEIDAIAAAMEAGTPSVPLVSNRSGEALAGPPGPRHWSEHARGTVRFSDGMASLERLGITTFLEVGPGPGLLSLGRTCLPGGGLWIPSLDPKREDWDVLLESLRQLHLAGHTIRWEEVDRGFDRRRLPLPTYPFQRRRHWLSDEPPHQRVAAAASPEATPPPAAFERAFQPDGACRAALREHRIHGEVVFPTTLILTEALAEGRERLGREVQIEDLTYHRALVLPPQGDPGVKFTFTPAENGRLSFRLMAEHGEGVWQQHAAGLIVPAVQGEAAQEHSPPSGDPEAGPELRPITAEELYPALRAIGLDYGPSLRSLTELRVSDQGAWYEVEAGDSDPGGTLAVRPFVLDACLHAYPLLAGDCPGVAEEAAGARPDPYLPMGIERVRLAERPVTGRIRVQARLRSGDADQPLSLDLRVQTGDGEPLASIEGLSLTRVDPALLRREGEQILSRWLYRLGWLKLPLPATPPAAQPGAWLLLADGNGTAERIAAELERQGQRCRLVFRRDPGAAPREGAVIDWDGPAGNDPEAFAAHLRALAEEEHLPVRGVIHAWALDGPPMEAMTAEGLVQAGSLGLRSTLLLLRALGGDERWAGARLWALTRGAMAVGEAGDPIEPAQAALTGLGRTLALEHPRSWGGVIDLPPGEEDPALVALEVLQEGGEAEVALRAEGRHVARLRPWRPPGDPGIRPLRTDGTVLVSGGLGMLGRESATWLVERHGVRRLLLTGRSGAGPREQDFIDGLRARGVEVSLLQADVSDPADVERIFTEIDRSGLPLRGIVHCAGVLADGIASQIRWEEFARGLAPKILGGWLLHHHCQARDLDLFLVHSSILSWTGSVGQGNYTAGNAFLDGLIDHRRSRGLPGSAIHWGPWAGEGMATHSGEKGEEIWRRLGVAFIERETGVRALTLLQEAGSDHGGLMLTDWQRFVAAQPASAPLLAELTDRPAEKVTTKLQTPFGGWGTRIRAAQGEELHGVLVAALCAEAAVELGFEEPIAADQPLSELGLDSLISVNLANRIEGALGIGVPLIHLVRGPSILELVESLSGDAEFQRRLGAVRGDGAVPSAPAPQFLAGSTNGHGGNGSGRPRGNRSAGRWLVMPEPRPEAKVRLFCFPYAGAGAPVFLPWTERLDPSIELVAVEPPGRAGRIDEPPLVDMASFMKGLVPDLEQHLDKPIALFGHCQGAMNLYEVARWLERKGCEPVHLFVSGARPPHHLFESGPFEEAMAEGLLKFSSYNPLRPLAEQPEEVFSEALRHFDIGDTEQFLTNPELRALILPAVRADFETLDTYKVMRGDPWNIPITCLVGLNDTYVSRRNAIAWSDYTRSMFKIHYLESSHYMIVEEREAIIDIINQDLISARPPTARSMLAPPVPV